MTTGEELRKVIRTLQAVPYFDGLDPLVAESISRQATQRQLDAGEILFLEGDTDIALYVVQSGWLKAVKISRDGREQVLHFIGPAEVFNLVGVFIESANPATVIALESTVVLVIPKATMIALLDEHPPLARAIIQRLAERVQQLIAMVEDFSLRSIEARAARYLLEQADSNEMTRQRWATQAEMANRLGTVPDVLNRVLRSLARANLIRVERHRIHILDPEGLRARAEHDK